MTSLAAREAYRLLAEDYDSAPNALLALETRTLPPLLPDLRGKTVVDVAAGTGRWSAYCASRGARTIAVDICREMLLRAPKPAVQADSVRLPLPDACADVTLCAFALGYAPAAFPELVRITRPGGRLIVSDVHPHAIQRGWSRTFRHQGQVMDIEHHAYTLEGLPTHDLDPACLLEPRLGEPERHIFEQAGRPDLFAQANRIPAIFVAKWIKR